MMRPKVGMFVRLMRGVDARCNDPELNNQTAHIINISDSGDCDMDRPLRGTHRWNKEDLREINEPTIIGARGRVLKRYKHGYDKQ